MVYVSTGGIKHTSIIETVKSFHDAGIFQIELSGGPYLPGGLTELQRVKAELSPCALSVHNYFPVPEVPFVFNLGSLNPEILSLSLAHARHSITWASALGSPYYSFHAGFLLDPQVKEIGQKIERRQLFNRNESMDQFLRAVKELAAFAKPLGVRLLVENNVLSEKNLNEFQENPLLCVTPGETKDCLSELGNDARLLVDVAHLKVSAYSLGFAKNEFFTLCDPYIDAYHLSDNDGTADTNQTFDESAWFFPFLKADVSFSTIEVYGKTPAELSALRTLVLAKGFRKG